MNWLEMTEDEIMAIATPVMDDMQTSRSFDCGFGFRENVGAGTSAAGPAATDTRESGCLFSNGIPVAF